MDDAMAARYWCHMCSQMVNPVMEIEIKCPFCQSGFVEEMGANAMDDNNYSNNLDSDSEFGSDRALSLWAPILLGMMGNQRPHQRRFRRLDFEGDDGDDDHNNIDHDHGYDDVGGRDIDSIIARRRRRRRNSAAILQLLQGIRAGLQSESENNENDTDRDRDRDRDRERERERERLVLINPFSQTIIVQDSYDGQNQNHTPIGSLGDYFIGPGLDLLLQHLAENDPNRYGTPPAKKEAIEALRSVKIEETLQCSVCLDDFEIGIEAKEMPCKHKFHSQCLLPWLELHSSCPVCRYELPADESKLESERSRNSGNNNQRERENGSNTGNHSGEDGDADGEGRIESGRRFSIPWPFNGLFSSTSQSGGNNSTSSSGSSGSSQTDES